MHTCMDLGKSEEKIFPEAGCWYWEVIKNRVIEHPFYLHAIKNSVRVYVENLHTKLPHTQAVQQELITACTLSKPNTCVCIPTYVLYYIKAPKPPLEVCSFDLRQLSY